MGHEPLILTSPQIRRHVRALVAQRLPARGVLSHAEIASEAQVRSVVTIGGGEMRLVA